METKWVIRSEQQMKDKKCCNIFFESFHEPMRKLSFVFLIKEAKQFETKEDALKQIKEITKNIHFHHRPFVIDEVIWI